MNKNNSNNKDAIDCIEFNREATKSDNSLTIGALAPGLTMILIFRAIFCTDSARHAPIQPLPLLLPARLGEPPLVQSSVPELTTKPTPNPSYCVLFSPVMSQLQLLLLLQLLQ
uniref:Uncharacterized protein n=1 Tax=Glossina pallidipes TaxID=7398 RepID=A0A1A9ZVP8_GLOPL